MRVQDLVCGALVVGAVALLAADDARACGACQDFTQEQQVGLSFRREPLPANTRLYVPGQGLDRSTIVVSATIDGAAVDLPFGIVDADDAVGSAFIDIDWPFTAEGELTIASNVGGYVYPIGTRVDDESPTAPAVEITAGGLSGACCETVGASVVATGAADADDEAGVPLLLKLVLSSSAGDRVAYFPYRGQVIEALGTSTEGCLASDPLAVDGEDVDATVSVIDWAGNESPAVQQRFTYATSTPGGCGPIGNGWVPGCTQGSTLPFAASVLVLALRRRSRAHRAR